MSDSRSFVSFGNRDVPEAEKEGLVHGVFSSVAGKYDLMNDLMSGGVHRLWKDRMAEWLNPGPGWTAPDGAGGARAHGGEAHIPVCDINKDMVGEGLRRARAKKETAIDWVAGNAEALPIPDTSMDAYTIAFGIRNVTHIDKALVEARRVLKPGGRFLCLEFSRVEAPGFDMFYESYSRNVLPRLGQLVAGDADAYRYLAESIRRFPPQGRFAKMIEKAGLSRVKVRNLTAGVAALHSAWKI